MSQELSPTPQSASAGISPASILVVDDDQTTCTFCARALSQVGYAVSSATEVDRALDILRGPQSIDLLLADIQMPGLSGLELAQIAREGDPAIAIIIMTGHATLDAIHQTARRGVADFLTKPFELDELRLAVDEALHKRQLLQERVRLRALEKILLSSEAINTILDLDQLCRVIIERACDHVPCDAAFLVLLAETVDQPAQVIAMPDGAVILPSGHAAALDALGTSGPLTQTGVPLGRIGDHEITTGVMVPLRAQGQAVGALLLCSEHSDLLAPSSQDTLALLANQAGTALRNAQLYGELQGAYHSLRELDRLKSEFLAIASHELRSPLSIVLGYTKMVRDRGEGEQREFAQRALDSAEQIKAIVDTMVRLRHYDLNQLTLSPELWPIADLIRQSVERLTPTADQKNQQIEIVLSDDSLTLPVDREKMLLVLGNLIDNAIKFSPQHAVIRVGLTRWHHEHILAAAGAAVPNSTIRRLSTLAETNWAVIRVSDPGEGLSREQQLRIFERFYQVAGSLTRDQGGAGLGLSLVADLAILQGGLVWVESMVGKGSIFSFALPYLSGGAGPE
ncbi:response regulator [Chloroflexales bacterium ZM16-3]|nr:response regulator [Chloroflexales bacterium ZM16-3]